MIRCRVEEHPDVRYGESESLRRTEFEIKAKALAIVEVIMEERKLARMLKNNWLKRQEQKRVLFQE